MSPAALDQTLMTKYKDAVMAKLPTPPTTDRHKQGTYQNTHDINYILYGQIV